MIACLSACFLPAACGGGAHGGTALTSGYISTGVVPNVATPIAAATNPASPVAPSFGASVTTAPVSHDPVPVTFRFALQNVSQTQGRLRLVQDANYGNGYTSSVFTPSIRLTVTPIGGSAAGPYTGACTSGTSGNCTVTFSAAPGATTFSGSLSENGNVVSRFAQTQVVQPNAANVISFTASPVVASVALQLAATSINAGTPQSVSLTVLAKDANGNTIAGTAPYVDANGTPVSISLQSTDVQAGGRGTARLTGPTRILAPTQTGTALKYDGNWLERATVTASANSSSVNMAGAMATLATIPRVTEYVTNGTISAAIGAADGNIWLAEGNNKVAKMSPAGILLAEYGGAGASVAGLALGADGALFYTDYSNSVIFRMTTGGITTNTYALTASAGPTGIAMGADGRMWAAEVNGGRVATVSVTGGPAVERPVNGVYPSGTILGPDGNIWVANCGSQFVSRLTPDGKETDFAFSDPNGAYHADSLALDANGNIWFPTNSGYYLARYSFAAGNVTVFSSGITANAGIRNVALGPDGYIWFTEYKTGRIGRMPTSGTMTATEYTPASLGIAAGAGAGLGVINREPDGSLWVGEYGVNRVAKLVF